MRSSTPTDEQFLQVMEQTGFYRAGKPTSGVFDAASLRTPTNGHADKAAKYHAVIDKDKIGATAIYELSGSPCIYFKTFDTEPSILHLEELHKTAWNQGLAPLMWVFTPTEIHIYNSFAKPEPTAKYTKTNKPELDVFQRTAEDLYRLNEFAGRIQFESGRFWQQEAARRINRDNRVDNSLLKDLQFAEQSLLDIGSSIEPKLRSSVAHSLLGRSIFAAYLKDRGIVDADFLRESFGHGEVADVLADKTSAYKFFHWIRTTFNGDLFPLAHEATNKQPVQEEDIVQVAHLRVIQNLLEGRGNKAGQGRLWRYEFDVIPVELISSIYEMFARSSNPGIAKQQSMHYTPFNLVDLVLSQICPRLPNKAKIADLSCGSGVFLVEGLRRLVARRAAEGESISRELVRETLYNQVFGVDISPEAIQIAAFSLYLTALELDDKPQPAEALKFERLLGRNLFAADSFNEQADFNRNEPFVSKNLDAIVGNPPWTQEPIGSPGRQYCKRHPDRPVAKNYLSQAFLWRVGDFASEKTHIGLILHASPFFSHTKEAYAAKSALLQRFKPDTLVNFAELRQENLFPKAAAPALVYIGTGSASEGTATFAYISAEWSGAFKNHGILEIGPENVRRLPVNRAATDPDMLKVASWGNARDMALIERLRDSSTFTTLGSLVKEWEWPLPAGGIREGGNHQLQDNIAKPYLRSGALPFFRLDVAHLAERSPDMRVAYAPSRKEIYQGPMVLAVRGLTRDGFYAAVAEEDVLYSEEYFGIPAIGDHAPQIGYINAVLNSSVTSYFLFLTGSYWGVERDKIELMDLLRVPFPIPANVPSARMQYISTLGKENNILGSLSSERRYLDEFVFELYNLSNNERAIVDDMVSISIDRKMKRLDSQAYSRSTNYELESYAKQFLGVVQPYFRALNTHTVIAEVFDVGNAPLTVVKFRIVPLASRHLGVRTVPQQNLQAVLGSIARELPDRIADRLYSRRNLRIYNENDVYIIKPAEKRFWSRSAGLNDADIVVAEHVGIRDASR